MKLILTESFVDKEQSQSSQIKDIVVFIMKTSKISDDCTVLLVSQLQYAVRVVLRINTNSKIFEGLVSYIYKKGDKKNIEPQLLVWREIDSVDNADPDIFSSYYRIIPSPFLENAIQTTFANQQSISKYNRLLMIEQKIAFNGIYYRLNIESKNKAFFEVIIFWVPDTDFFEIQKYEILSNGYEITEEKRIKDIPTNDKYFEAAVIKLIDSFGSQLSNSQPVIMANHNHDSTYNYRLVFSGTNGRF